MKFSEEPAIFNCADETLVGILSRPETPDATGVVVIVGGPQYRAGSHRQFVLLARTLAAAGYGVLRFDYRGMGDSTGDQRRFDGVSDDVGAAIEELQKRIPNVTRVCLWGLCDGASAALLYCHEKNDPRVKGLCLLNPWLRSAASLARTQIKHYYTRRLIAREFWVKLLTGKVAPGAARGFAKKLLLWGHGRTRPAPSQQTFQQRMAAAWRCFGGNILLVLSREDHTAREFLEFAHSDPVWKMCLAQATVVRHDVAGADHTFSTPGSRQLVENLTLDWLTSQGAQSKCGMNP